MTADNRGLVLSPEALAYDEAYYERGVLTGKSCYSDYRWIPELTIPLAATIVDYLGIPRGDSVVDIGCAKGYVVKALRWLGREAYGVDISSYAIEHADPEIATYVSTTWPKVPMSYAIAKDVFEHFTPPDLADYLATLRADILFVIVPLGDGDRYIAPANEMDITHVIRQPLTWWTQQMQEAGWRINSARFRVPGIKEHYADIEGSMGFIVAERWRAD